MPRQRVFAVLSLYVVVVVVAAHIACRDAKDPVAGPPALVIRNARIFTGNPAVPWAEAMAIRDDVIVYVGTEEGVRAFANAAGETHDLDGRLVLPGFHDVHQHTLEAHLPIVDCSLDGEASDPESYVESVASCKPSSGTGWILGSGHSILTLRTAKRDPRLILDDAQPDVPVAILEETSHSTWVNTKALEVLGITAATPNPEGGLIVHNKDGKPNGILIDAAGEFPWDRALVPTPSLADINLAALRDGMAHNAEYGITSAVDARAYTQRGYLDAYERLNAEHGLTTRMVLSLWASPTANDDEQIARLKTLFRDDGGRLRITQIKFYSDGLLQNTTAALLEPYTSAETFGPNTGLSYFPQVRLEKYLLALGAVGFDAHIHAIGDRAVRESIDAVRTSRALVGGASRRHRLTHVELTHPQDVARVRAAGISVDMQLGPHTEPSKLAETEEFIGHERATERSWVLRDLWNAGGPVALSSDFDVGELNPFPTIARSLDRGRQSLPDMAAAVKAYTFNGAYIMRSESRTGSLEVGKAADFFVVDQDIFTIPPADVAKTRVLWTLVGGRQVFRRDGFKN